ncbi:protein jag [Brachybacterium saurashtrense]|uniref:RNA-binding protein n=1 Tax=Brachybacterium saurashtrense TaxID=556288 RepID=A0A345YRP7_9MICO|nr:R3H domain-containing nucleic acid-binding protein [Brachybacterium saurashtrense]AXK46599.1 RNA-binding protein [Brachybacterium saurashtrense]RRR24340.1 RNA-binding protein [Brachybacterium saurashtrense]
MNETTPDLSEAGTDAAQQVPEADEAQAETASSAESTSSPAPDHEAAPAAGAVSGAGEAVDADDAEEQDAESAEERLRRLEEEGDIAADYLEELLDIADLDGDIDIDVDGDRASVEIRGADQLARLNRPKGELLDALQELARLAVQTRTGHRSRLMLDIGGFRAEHKGDLEQLAATAIAEAKESGAAVPLRAMNPFERKVVHDVAKREGLRSESDGDGKSRHVVIYPAS